MHAEADYKASARFDDELEIGIRCVRLGNTSMTLNAGVFRSDEVLTTGSLAYVHANEKTQEKSPLPEVFRARILEFEKMPPEQA